MTSTIMMKCLVLVYSIICITCLLEKNWPKAMYWASAGCITISVLWGMK